MYLTNVELKHMLIFWGCNFYVYFVKLFVKNKDSYYYVLYKCLRRLTPNKNIIPYE